MAGRKEATKMSTVHVRQRAGHDPVDMGDAGKSYPHYSNISMGKKNNASARREVDCSNIHGKQPDSTVRDSTKQDMYKGGIAGSHRG